MKKILFLCAIMFFCFCVTQATAENSGDVVINEIAWMGTAISANDEWLELKNLTGAEIDLNGWTLEAADGAPKINLTGKIGAGAYFLLERTDDDTAPAVTADQIYVGALGNDGETLILKDKSGNEIDRIDSVGAWAAGDNTAKLTMERTESGGWQSGAEAGTPKAKNSDSNQTENPENNPTATSTNEDNTEVDDDSENDGTIILQQDATVVSGAKTGDAVINEIVSDPADGEVEWVEIYNRKNVDISLNGWWIEDGSGAKTMLNGILGGSGSKRYFVILKPKGNLNNAGDVVILKDCTGKLIDQAAYGNWDDGNMDDNAPVAKDPESIARESDGKNSHNNKNDFIITEKPTKGSANIIESSKEESNDESSQVAGYDYSSNIIISEIYPNPAGPDDGDTPLQIEFIELFNAGSIAVNLNGWSVGDATDKKFNIAKLGTDGSLLLGAGKHLAIFRTDSKIALNNTKESVLLFEPFEDKPLYGVEYEKTEEGKSYAVANIKSFSAGVKNGKELEYAWTEKVTPGEENVFAKVNHEPALDFTCSDKVLVKEPQIFDSSDTVDEDGDKLSFFWDFGDGATNTLAIAEHTFLKIGTFCVSLTISDGQATATKEKIVRVAESLSDWDEIDFSFAGEDGKSADIIINELMPDPAGSDTALYGEDGAGEWIELFNNGQSAVSLLNWKVDDEEGGSSPYEFKKEEILDAGKCYILDRAKSGLALNNDSDEVRLLNFQDEIIDSVDYVKPKEGEAYARGLNGKWFWSTTPTPAKENTIIISDSSMVEGYAISEGSGALTKSVKSGTFSVPLTEIASHEAGDVIVSSGTVAVLPSILGSQYFYIVSGAGDEMTGVQIYSYKKDFPALKIGDVIEVTGAIGITQGEMRIKIKTKDGIQIIGSGIAPDARLMSIEAIGDENVGQLVSVSGDITEAKSTYAFIDDGSGELKIYIKATTGISAKTLKEGSAFTVSGILGQTSSGLRLMPRSQDDIVMVGTSSAEVGQVLGEVAVSDTWTVAERDKRLEFFKYLLVGAFGIIAVLGGILFKVGRKKG